MISPLENYRLFDYVIYRCVVGSKAFGLDDANSDTDRRGIYLPPADIHWSMFGVPEQIESKETEECYWELRKFLTLAPQSESEYFGMSLHAARRIRE